jgi:hypothetical protein
MSVEPVFIAYSCHGNVLADFWALWDNIYDYACLLTGNLLVSNRRSASLEIPRFLWNRKVHYRVHTIPPLSPALSHTDPLHTLIYIFKVHYIRLLPQKGKKAYKITSLCVYVCLCVPD